tara:strand:+ start:163 stop:711 length:549 start_codon:yes stop_codon:yes gene_type:complete
MNIIEKIEKLLETTTKRLSWDEYFISLTLLLAARSPSKRLQVGSIVVKNNRIISSGYNGFPSSTPHTPIMKDGHEINTIHAEINTICDAAKRGVSIDGATMYINYFPCIYCTKSIIASGIKHIVYYRDYRNDDLVHTLLHNSNINIKQFRPYHMGSILKRVPLERKNRFRPVQLNNTMLESI